MIISIEEEEIKKKNKKSDRKKNKDKEVGRIQGLGKIVPKQIRWRLVEALSKVCLKNDLFEFTNFAFQEVFNGFSFQADDAMDVIK